MNFKKAILLLLLSGSFLVSCKNIQRNLDRELTSQEAQDRVDQTVGSWEDLSEAALHFTLFKDGTAQSDNMETLAYQKWNITKNQLYLVSKSIGNRTSSMDTLVYEILKLDPNQMVLKRDELTYRYKKVNTKDRKLAKEIEKTLKGRLILGHETKSFEPCGGDKVFWILDKTTDLKKLYEQLTAEEKPYTPIFAEIEIIDKGKSNEGFQAAYESVFEVVRVLKTSEISEESCKL